MARFLGCILLKFYIKPQHYDWQGYDVHSCILLKFYIKPQQRSYYQQFYIVVSY